LQLQLLVIFCTSGDLEPDEAQATAVLGIDYIFNRQ